MPFQSQAQRRKFYAMANRGEISRDTVKEWEDATPKGKKLPEHKKVKKAYETGAEAALELLGIKRAGEELRLKIPERTFHGFDSGMQRECERANKKVGSAADDLVSMLRSIDDPDDPVHNLATRDPLDRATAWGPPSNLTAGDTASRLSDMSLPTQPGMVF